VVAIDVSTVAASMVTMTDTGRSATVVMTGVDAGTTAGAAGFGGSRVADAIGARPMVMTRTAASPLSVVIIRRVRDLGRRADATRAGEDDWFIEAAPPERQAMAAHADGAALVASLAQPGPGQAGADYPFCAPQWPVKLPTLPLARPDPAACDR
jgi:hypothetical protein